MRNSFRRETSTLNCFCKLHQRKTIVNSWVRCLENNQLVITSGFPTVNLGNDRNSDYKYTILVLETQYLSSRLLHFINSYLGIYLKTKKLGKQQNKWAKKTKQKRKKKEEGKKKVVSRIWTQCLRVDPTSHSHYAIEDEHMIWWKVSNLMCFPRNFRRQMIEPYLTDWKNDSKQLDEIKANWNQDTDSKRQCKRISWQ